MTTTTSLPINFAPRSFRSVWFSTPLWIFALAAVGIGLILFSWYTAYVISEQSQVLADTVVRLEKKQKAAQQPIAKAVVIPQARALMINAAIQQLNLPWSDLFDAIEAATPANIALIAIEPDAKKHLIKGTAEALNSDDMLAYVEQLKKQPLFVNVVLIKHEVNQQDQYKPYRFEFTAQWAQVTP